MNGALAALGRWLDEERVRVYPRAMLALFLLAGLVAPSVGAAMELGDPPAGGDFAAFYTAGHAVLDGRLDVLTDLAAQERYQTELLHHREGSLWSPWVSPPALAYLFVPFALLPFGWACALEVALLLLALGLALRGLGRRLAPTLPTRSLWVGALAFFPTFASLLGQQLTAIFVLLWLWMVGALLDGRSVRAGLCLGAFAIKPQLAVGVGLYLLLRRDYRAAGTALGCAVGFALLSLALVPEASLHWVTHVPELMAYLRQGGYPVWGQYGSLGAAALLLDVMHPTVALVVGALYAGGLLFALWRLARRPLDDRGALAAALTVALLLSPHLYVYDLGLLLVPFALAYPALEAASGDRRLHLRGAVGLVFITCFVGTFVSMAEVNLTRATLGVGAALQLGLPALLLCARRFASGGLDEGQRPQPIEAG